jgi:amino acid transporter
MLIVGIIVGAGIFETSPKIAGLLGNPWLVMAIWCLGGFIALCGALSYAELVTAFPRPGGDYSYLKEAFHRRLGMFFAWCDFLIIRPCNIGMMAYVFARYARKLIVLDHPYGLVMLAVAAVVGLSLLHLVGLRPGVWSLNILVFAKIVGLALVVGTAAWLVASGSRAIEPWPMPQISAEGTGGGLSLALLFVLFTFGGWAEVSFVAAEIRNPRRNGILALVFGVIIVTVIYLAFNLTAVLALGLDAFSQSEAVAHDVIEQRLGAAAASAVDVLICISCLGAIQGTMLAGSRLYFAWGSDSRWLDWLGQWNEDRDLPVRAILLQSGITLGLIVGFGPDQGAFGRLIVFSTPLITEM